MQFPRIAFIWDWGGLAGRGRVQLRGGGGRLHHGEGVMATTKRAFMKLTEAPEIVTWPETRYVFIEKIGPFQQTAPQAWQELHRLVPGISEDNKITGYLSLYKIWPKIYRAGVALATTPVRLPESVRYEQFQGGKYCRFVLTGPYANLPEASGRVFEIIAEKQMPVRDDYCIENYVNDPRTTPEEQLITEILIPTI
jgi:effector-binding domain-containing protein